MRAHPRIYHAKRTNAKTPLPRLITRTRRLPFFFSAAPDPPPTAPPPPTSTANDLRDKGIAIANEAVQSDNAGNYEDAIIKYCKAAEYLMRSRFSYENDPVMLNKIRGKCTEYTSRAETLKKLRREAEERERAPIMVEATVVVPQAQPVVPMGLPVTTSETCSSQILLAARRCASSCCLYKGSQ